MIEKIDKRPDAFELYQKLTKLKDDSKQIAIELVGPPFFERPFGGFYMTDEERPQVAYKPPAPYSAIIRLTETSIDDFLFGGMRLMSRDVAHEAMHLVNDDPTTDPMLLREVPYIEEGLACLCSKVFMKSVNLAPMRINDGNYAMAFRGLERILNTHGVDNFRNRISKVRDLNGSLRHVDYASVYAEFGELGVAWCQKVVVRAK